MEIEENFYLRFYNDDTSASTVALIESKSEGLNSTHLPFAVGGTICSSLDCANCCGCIPDGLYCKTCSLNSDDCSRTTSSFYLE